MLPISVWERKKGMIYIAGPYSGKTSSETSVNITRARTAAMWCAKNLIRFFCPHTHTAHFEIAVPGTPKEFYYALDLKIAEICTAIMLLKNWEASVGAMKELAFFADKKLPIFLFPVHSDTILEWAKKERAE